MFRNRKELLETANTYGWDIVSMMPELPQDFIREFKCNVNWDSISLCNTTLTENFIREFSNKLNWVYISAFHDLTEDFIREFKDEVKWHWILNTQNLSDEFKEEFKEYL